MPEPILIEFRTNTDEVEQAIDAMEKLGLVDKQTAEGFKKTTAESRKYAEEMAKTGQTVDAVTIDMKDLLKAIQNLPKKIIEDTAKKSLEDLDKGVKIVTTDTVKLTTQLRALKQQLSEMEQAGLQNTKTYQKVAIEAGKLEDQIGDTAARVKILASDSKNLDAALSLATGVAGGFAVAQGAAALFGQENEDVQKALLKVQAALAIVNGLQAVAATLNKTSAASVMGLTLVQKGYNYFIDQTTGKMIALRVATAGFITLGVAAVVVGLVYVFRKWNEEMQEAQAASERLQKVNEAAITIYSKEAAELTGLVQVMKDENSTNEDKQKVLQTVNEKYADQIGHFTDIEDLETRFIGRAEAYIKVLQLRAQAQAAMNLATEEYEKKLTAQNTTLEESLTTWDKIKIGVASVTKINALAAQTTNDVTQRQADAIADSQENFESYIDMFNDFTDQANKIVDEFSFDKKIVEGTAKMVAAVREILPEEPFAILQTPEELQTEITEPALVIVEDFYARIKEFRDANAEQERIAREEYIQGLQEAYNQNAAIAEAGLGTLNSISQTAANNEIANLEELLAQKKISQEQFDKASAEARTKEAKRNKLMAFAQSLIDIPKAFLVGLTTPGGGLPLAIFYGALAATESALIAAQKIPQFAEGTKYVEGGIPGKDSVHALLMPGERVITTKKNREYTPILDAIHEGRLPSGFLNALAEMNLPNFGSLFGLMGISSGGSGGAFDYDRLGDVISKSSEKKSVHVNIDKNGLDSYVINAGNKVHYLNQRYSS